MNLVAYISIRRPVDRSEHIKTCLGLEFIGLDSLKAQLYTSLQN